MLRNLLLLVLIVLALGGCAYREVKMFVPATGQQEIVRFSRHEPVSQDAVIVHCWTMLRVGPDEYVCGTSRYWRERSRR